MEKLERIKKIERNSELKNTIFFLQKNSIDFLDLKCPDIDLEKIGHF